MKLDIGAFATIDWEQVSTEKHAGDSGFATWRTVQKGDIRIRIVEYSRGYLADHWCEKGHIIFVVDGELITKLRDGREIVLKKGMSYTVKDGGEAHRSETPRGAILFIED